MNRLALLTVTALASCNPASSGPPAVDGAFVDTADTADASAADADAAPVCVPVPLPGDVQSSSATRASPGALASPDVVRAATDTAAFALAMYAHLAALTASSPNLFFAPWSITSALAMTYAGAANATATQMATAMSSTLPAASFHPAINTIDQTISLDAMHPPSGMPIEFCEANALFLRQGFSALPSYLDTLATDYGTGVSDVDLTNDASRVQIDTWVSAVTDGQIPALLPPMSLVGVVAVLVNAAYFDAPWAVGFDPTETRPERFTRADGTTVIAQMMNSNPLTFPTATAAGWSAVEIPYANQQTAMLVVMPDAGTLADFEASLDAGELAMIEGSLTLRNISFGLPQFSLHGSYDLVTPLTTLGMIDAFGVTADFSGIDGATDLWIRNIFHQATVYVSESGTIATAATASTQQADAISENDINFDHPFLVFIIDLPTTAILFAGRVGDPTAM